MSNQTERRPPKQGHSLPGREHAPSAWVTNDLDRAIEIFTRRYGVAAWNWP